MSRLHQIIPNVTDPNMRLGGQRRAPEENKMRQARAAPREQPNDPERDLEAQNYADTLRSELLEDGPKTSEEQVRAAPKVKIVFVFGIVLVVLVVIIIWLVMKKNKNSEEEMIRMQLQMQQQQQAQRRQMQQQQAPPAQYYMHPAHPGQTAHSMQPTQPTQQAQPAQTTQTTQRTQPSQTAQTGHTTPNNTHVDITKEELNKTLSQVNKALEEQTENLNLDEDDKDLIDKMDNQIYEEQNNEAE